MTVDLREILNKNHAALFNSTAPIVVFRGSAGSGKSYSVASYLLLKPYLENIKQMKGLIIKKSLPSLKKTIEPIIAKMCKKMGISYKLNKSDYVARAGRLTIIFGSMNNSTETEKIMSLTDLDFIWVEEADQVNPADFHRFVMTRLRGGESKNKQVVFSLNPNRNSWIYKDFIGSKRIRDDVLEIKTTLEDNIFLSDQDILQYKKSLESLKKYSPTLYNIYALGEWGDITVSDVFNIDNFNYFVYSDFADIFNNGAFKVAYCDLAFSENGDYTVIVEGVQHLDGYIYIVNVARHRGNTDKTVKFVAEYCLDNNINLIGIESNFRQLEDVENIETLLRRLSCNTVVEPVQNLQNKDTRIRWNAMLVNKYCKFRNDFRNLEDYSNFMSELGQYGNWDKKSDAHDDDADAITCLVSKMFVNLGVQKQNDKKIEALLKIDEELEEDENFYKRDY